MKKLEVAYFLQMGLDKLSIILWLLWLCDGSVGLYEASVRLKIDRGILLKISKELSEINLLNQ